MRCPRCHAPVEIARPASAAARGKGPAESAASGTPAFCRECGAPLRLGDEPRPSPLDASLTMDRRTTGRVDTVPVPPGAAVSSAPAAVPPAPDALGELAALERSHWDLRVAPPAGAAAAPASLAIALEATGATPPVPIAVVDELEVHLRRPEPWRRAAAGAIDVLPFAAGGIALARSLVRAALAGLPAPPTGLDGLLDLVARERVIVLSIAAAVTLALGLYATLAHALAGATLGKRLLGLRVVGPDGARPTLGRSAARSALVVLSAALLGLGVLLAFFTRSGRALHDLLARTWVVEAP